MLRQIILVSVVALQILTPSEGQFKQRDVSGMVTDARGNPLPKAAVQLENTRDLTVRSYITGGEMLIDDGLATGSAMPAAVRHVRTFEAARYSLDLPWDRPKPAIGCARR